MTDYPSEVAMSDEERREILDRFFNGGAARHQYHTIEGQQMAVVMDTVRVAAFKAGMAHAHAIRDAEDRIKE